MVAKLISSSAGLFAPSFGPSAAATGSTEPMILARSGSFEARLTRKKKDIRKAQRLRYEVFFERGGARADATATLIRRDICRLDRHCDHLIVFDTSALNRLGKPKPKAVGTYRLLRQEVAQVHDGFYSQREFDIAPLLSRHPDKRFLELGRSCVEPDYRSRKVLDLLWRGLYAYIKMHRIDVLIGCASLPGTNPLALATELSFLHHHAGARDEWRASALPERLCPLDIIDKTTLSPRVALGRLPPLLKGYLRLGAQIGEGAVIDRAFGTTDVFVVLPIAEADTRYLAHFGGDSDQRVA